MLAIFACNSIYFLIRIPCSWSPLAPIRNPDGYTLIESKLSMVPYWMLPKFPPIRLLVFKKISHLYFYSESSFIWNSRVSNVKTLRTIAQNFCYLLRKAELYTLKPWKWRKVFARIYRLNTTYAEIMLCCKLPHKKIWQFKKANT